MNTPPRTPLPAQLAFIFPWAEKICLLALALCLLVKDSGTLPLTIILIAASVLAGVYFLSAYLPPPESPEDEKDQKQGDFKDLLFRVIVPKVLWIGCSVAVIGILFLILKYQGWETMVFIPATTLSPVIIFVGIAIATGGKRVDALIPILYRAIPLTIICIYVLMTKGSGIE